MQIVHHKDTKNTKKNNVFVITSPPNHLFADFGVAELALRYSGLMNQAPTYRDRDVAPTKEAIHELPLLHY
jgi:hypothetical protein